jgi:hypothetical protein
MRPGEAGREAGPTVGRVTFDDVRANGMRPRDAFGVAVRTVGLIISLIGLNYLVSAVSVSIMQSAMTSPFLGQESVNSFVSAPAKAATLMGAMALTVGFSLLFGARQVVTACYGPED